MPQYLPRGNHTRTYDMTYMGDITGRLRTIKPITGKW